MTKADEARMRRARLEIVRGLVRSGAHPNMVKKLVMSVIWDPPMTEEEVRALLDEAQRLEGRAEA